MTTPNAPAALKAAVLSEALPYIRRFAGSVFVIKYGGNAMTEQHGKKGEFVQGMRVTDAETMKIVEMVLGGSVNKEIVSLINRSGGRAVGITGRDDRFIRAQKLLLDIPRQKSADIGQVGTVAAIDTALVRHIIAHGGIPVIAPVGEDENGAAFNINADLVAGKLAEEMQAEKLLMMTNTGGVMDKNGSLLPRLDTRRIAELTADGTLFGGMLPKIQSALDAATHGVKAVHIIDGRTPNALLLETLTDEGIGTMISA